MSNFPKDETIKKWICEYKSKEALEKEMLKRLEFVEQDYEAKKNKIQYILNRLKEL